MQINTRATHDASVARMGGLAAQIDRLNASISLEKRIITADDDPIGAARVATIDRRLAANQSLQGGIDRAASRLGSTDAALDGVGAVLQRAKEVALLGNTATLNAADRATLAAEARQLGEQLLGYANAVDSDGAALFGGARSAAPAYAAGADGVVAWRGAGTAAALALDTGTIPAGIDGPRVFDGLPGASGPADAFALLDALGMALGEPDAAVRTAALAAAQTGLDAAISRTADTRATVGTRMARLETETLRLDAAGLALKTDRAKTDGFDAAQAIARLQQLSTVLEAAQLSFVKVSGLSLWNMLR